MLTVSVLASNALSSNVAAPDPTAAGGMANMSLRTFYVSAWGSDNNNGTSPATPWQSIAKVSATTFLAGDAILFKGGETFSGGIVLGQSGTSINRITIGSY